MDEKINILLNKCSFSELLNGENITDISYNGEEIFYMDTYKGRVKYQKNINYEEIKNLIRDIANTLDLSFSVSTPIMDVSFMNFRINAIHDSICKKNGNKRICFSIRKFSTALKISNNNEFYPEQLDEFLHFILDKKSSILITGLPNSGKTEFQKYLMSLFKNNERLIVIDSINELDIKTSCDTTFLIPEKLKFSSIEDLIKVSLRLNPDYIVLAEARGREFKNVYQSMLTGLSTITTLHSKDCISALNRMVNLLNDENSREEEILKNLKQHIDFIINLGKEDSDFGIKRFIKEVYLLYKEELYLIYSNYGKSKFFKLPKNYVNENYSLIRKWMVNEVLYE